MPYTKEHKNRSRDRIIASAITLFSSRGFDNVTLDAVMAHAGMTRGAFYNHFNSKQDLYAEAMNTAALQSPMASDAPKGVELVEHLQCLVENYLSKAHLQDAINPCLMAFMVTDVANQEPEVRKTYTRIFKGFSKRLTEMMDGDDTHHKQHAQALAALMIGGVAVCRTFTDAKLVDEVLAACRQLAATVIEVD